MQEKTFNRLLDERMDQIREISKKIKYTNLTYHYITPGIRPTNFIEFRGPLHIFFFKKNGDKTMQAAEKGEIKLISKLDEITSGNSKHKLENQKDTIENAQNLYNSRQKAIGLFNDYSKIRYDNIYETK